LNPALDCLQGYGKKFPQYNFFERIGTALVSLASDEESGYNPYDIPNDLVEGFVQRQKSLGRQARGIVLITQYFESEHAREDIENALRKNLENPMISEVVLLNEFEFTRDLGFLPHAEKIKKFVIKQRLTFAIAFSFANDYYPNRTIILANSDIYFDNSLVRLGDTRTLQLNRQVLVLTKWTPADNGVNMNLRTDSQDAWIFQPPMNTSVIAQSDFYLGAVRCDNRIAEILHTSGHPLINPSFAIHAIELQTLQRTGIYDLKGAAMGDVRDVFFSDKHIF